jgi:hypothetical protein
MYRIVFIFFAVAHGVPTAYKEHAKSATPPTCEEECEGKTKALMPAVQTAADWFDHKLEAKYGTVGAVDLVGKLCGNNTSSPDDCSCPQYRAIRNPFRVATKIDCKEFCSKVA